MYWYGGSSLLRYCTNRCTTYYVWQTTSYCDPYANKYRYQANCQSSNCDWYGYGYQYAGCSCGSFQVFYTNYSCGNGTLNYLCSYSDVRLKRGIETIKDALTKIMEIEAVEYDWNEKLPPQVYEFFKHKQKLHAIGLIAQNVRLYFPEVVMINSEGYYSINYEKLNAVLVEGIKEQSLFIEDIDKELNYIESKLS